MRTCSLNCSDYWIVTHLLGPFCLPLKLKEEFSRCLDFSFGSLWMWKLTASPCLLNGPIKAEKTYLFHSLTRWLLPLSTCPFFPRSPNKDTSSPLVQFSFDDSWEDVNKSGGAASRGKWKQWAARCFQTHTQPDCYKEVDEDGRSRPLGCYLRWHWDRWKRGSWMGRLIEGCKETQFPWLPFAAVACFGDIYSLLSLALWVLKAGLKLLLCKFIFREHFCEESALKQQQWQKLLTSNNHHHFLHRVLSLNFYNLCRQIIQK